MKTAALISCLLLAAFAAEASTLLEASLEQLTAYSDAVVRVRVTSTRVVRADARHLVTIAECETLEVLKGQPGPTVRVATPGGVLDELGQTMPGAARFVAGEEAVLFLSQPLNGTWLVTGMEQGKWNVDARGATPAQTVSLVDRSGRPVVRAPLAPLPWAALKARLLSIRRGR